MNSVGVDLGVTKIAAGVVSPESEVLSWPTENSRRGLLETLVQAISKVGDGFELDGVA